MITLALFGGTPIRTRPFPSWPVFGKAEEDRLLRVLRSGHWGRLDGTEVAEFEQRFAAMHGCRQAVAVVNGTVALRIALLAAGIQAEDEVIVPALHVRRDCDRGARSERGPGLCGHRSAHIQSGSDRRGGRDHTADEGDHPGAFRRAACGHGRDHGAGRGSRHPRARGRRARAWRRRTGTVPPVRWDTSPRSRFSRARTSPRARGASSRRMTKRWPRRAARFTTAGACRAVCGTSTTSSPATTASANSRGPCSTASSIAWRSRRRRATATAGASPRGWRRCRAFIHSGVLRNARGTAITCSCCESTPEVFGASRGAVLSALGGRRHPVLRRLRLLAARPAAVPQQGVRTVPAAGLRPARLRHDTLPEQRRDLPRAGVVARSESAARRSMRTSTTSPARSRRCTRTATSWTCDGAGRARVEGAQREHLSVGHPRRDGRDRSADDHRRALPDRRAPPGERMGRARRPVRARPADPGDGDLRPARGVRVPVDRATTWASGCSRTRSSARRWRRSSS